MRRQLICVLLKTYQSVEAVFYQQNMRLNESIQSLLHLLQTVNQFIKYMKHTKMN